MLTTLIPHPLAHNGADTTRIVVATFGQTAIVQDTLAGRREEWKRVLKADPDVRGARYIDGLLYEKVGTVVPVKREGVLA